MEAEAAWRDRDLAKAFPAAGELTTYPSHTDVGYLLNLMATEHPDIAKISFTGGVATDAADRTAIVANPLAIPGIRFTG